jgi:putative membrane protein
MRLIYREFLKYKFLNSLFLGVSIGTIFTIYEPLKPSIYSAGGIALAVAMILIAKLYSKILNITYFYRISLLVELVLLFVICAFLLLSYNYLSALIVYVGYQMTFSFGSYLVRAETLFLKKADLLKMVDIIKQKGYLTGMLISYLFYKLITVFFHIHSKKLQVYDIHILLLGIELAIIFYIFRSFKAVR